MTDFPSVSLGSILDAQLSKSALRFQVINFFFVKFKSNFVIVKFAKMKDFSVQVCTI